VIVNAARGSLVDDEHVRVGDGRWVKFDGEAGEDGDRGRGDFGLGIVGGERKAGAQPVAVEVAGVEPQSWDGELVDEGAEVDVLAAVEDAELLLDAEQRSGRWFQGGRQEPSEGGRRRG
jgi:hypothetical protein